MDDGEYGLEELPTKDGAGMRFPPELNKGTAKRDCQPALPAPPTYQVGPVVASRHGQESQRAQGEKRLNTIVLSHSFVEGS